MADEKTPPSAPSPSPWDDRPEPPPFRPNRDLIGYMEKGQRPATRRSPQRDTR